MSTIRTYSELIKFETFEDRFRYLKLDGKVGNETFGFDRYLNQRFYHSDPEYRRVRNQVIARDLGRELGVEGYDILGRIYLHHMNPITPKDIVYRTDFLLNPEYLISCSFDVHQAIHYGDKNLIPYDIVERTPNDMCPWKVG